MTTTTQNSPAEFELDRAKRKELFMAVLSANSLPAPRPIRATDNKTGATLMLVPSQSRPGLLHVVGASACDCRGFQARGRCSHLEIARRELAAQTGRYCEICCRYEKCHCSAMRSGCDRCIPQSVYAQRLGEPVQMRSSVPLIGRLA